MNELRELPSKTVPQILHRNIRGLLGKKPIVLYVKYWMLSRTLTFFSSVSETHMSTEDEAQAQIDGFTYVGKSRTSDQGGGVGAYISSFLSFHRRLDLEQEDIDCMWLEVLLSKTKRFLIGMPTALQIRQNVSSRILIANFNQCYQICTRRIKNAS